MGSIVNRKRANNNNGRNLPRRNNQNYNRQELTGQRRNSIGSQYSNNNIENRRRYPNGQNRREQHGFFNNNIQSRRRYNNGWEQVGYYQPRKQSYNNQFMKENYERRAGENYPRIYPMRFGFSQRAAEDGKEAIKIQVIVVRRAILCRTQRINQRKLVRKSKIATLKLHIYLDQFAGTYVQLKKECRN